MLFGLLFFVVVLFFSNQVAGEEQSDLVALAPLRELSTLILSYLSPKNVCQF